MSSIYLKLTIEKNCCSQNFDFLSLTICQFCQISAFGELQLTTISFYLKTSCCNLKIKGLGAKLLILKGIIGVLKSKGPCLLLNKNLSFDKKKTEPKMENSTHGFRETNHVLQLI